MPEQLEWCVHPFHQICIYTQEEWKIVPGSPIFRLVSNYGRIKNKHGKMLGNSKEVRGYVYSGVSASGFSFVHQCVLRTFIGPPGSRMQVCHNNGDPGNNRLENLRWDTPENNQLDRKRHGTANTNEQMKERSYKAHKKRWSDLGARERQKEAVRKGHAKIPPEEARESRLRAWATRRAKIVKSCLK